MVPIFAGVLGGWGLGWVNRGRGGSVFFLFFSLYFFEERGVGEMRLLVSGMGGEGKGVVKFWGGGGCIVVGWG